MAVHGKKRGDTRPGPPPPSFQTIGTIMGTNEIHHWEFWSGHFSYTNFWVPDPLPPPPFSSNVSLGTLPWTPPPKPK